MQAIKKLLQLRSCQTSEQPRPQRHFAAKKKLHEGLRMLGQDVPFTPWLWIMGGRSPITAASLHYAGVVGLSLRIVSEHFVSMGQGLERLFASQELSSFKDLYPRTQEKFEMGSEVFA